MTKSTITRERLQELAAGQSGFNLRTATYEESQELARIALAAMDSESDCKERKLFCSTDTTRMRKTISVSAGTEDAPLYRHAQQPVVPEEITSAIEGLKQSLVECNRYNYCFDAVTRVENACRAAMLNGGKP